MSDNPTDFERGFAAALKTVEGAAQRINIASDTAICQTIIEFGKEMFDRFIETCDTKTKKEFMSNIEKFYLKAFSSGQSHAKIWIGEDISAKDFTGTFKWKEPL